MAERSPSRRFRAAGALCILATVLSGAGCGKKAPLRLPEQAQAESAGELGASVRESTVTLTFRVPRKRLFPEREDPWVLARILRRETDSTAKAEVGTLFESDGFPFEARLTWSEGGRQPSVPITYQVEFRDDKRRRRALTERRSLHWTSVPGSPTRLLVESGEGSVSLSWEPPEGEPEGLIYRLYRWEGAVSGTGTALGQEPGPELSRIDTRVVAGREYCYAVRAVLRENGLDIEGPASEAACVHAVDVVPPPAPTSLRAQTTGDGTVVISWEPVDVPDLLGYYVWRAFGEGVLERISDGHVVGTVFRDPPAETDPRKIRRYAVTAIDRSARRNESSFSPLVTVEPALLRKP